MTLTELFTNIANAIRGKDGTTATIAPTDFASRISAIETGVDTSDATATASDMADGVTAYVNGEKITGNVEIYDNSSALVVSAQSRSENGSNLATIVINSSDSLLRSGGSIIINDPLTNFGDATGDDVVYGKTYTSSAGLKMTGLMLPFKHIDVAKTNITITKDSYGQTVFKVSDDSISNSNGFYSIDMAFYVSGTGDHWYITRCRGSNVIGSNGAPTQYCDHELYYDGAYDCSVCIATEDGYVAITCLDNGTSDTNVYDLLSDSSMLDPTNWKNVYGDIYIR